MGWGEMTALEAARARSDRGLHRRPDLGRPHKSTERGRKVADSMGCGHGKEDRQRAQEVPQGGSECPVMGCRAGAVGGGSYANAVQHRTARSTRQARITAMQHALDATITAQNGGNARVSWGDQMPVRRIMENRMMPRRSTVGRDRRSLEPQPRVTRGGVTGPRAGRPSPCHDVRQLQRRRLVHEGRGSISNEAGVLDSAPRLMSVLDTSILYGF